MFKFGEEWHRTNFYLKNLFYRRGEWQRWENDKGENGREYYDNSLTKLKYSEAQKITTCLVNILSCWGDRDASLDNCCDKIKKILQTIRMLYPKENIY